MLSTLVRRDLLEMEQRLRSDLAKILQFDSYAVYFPLDAHLTEPKWIAEEKRLLLPLSDGKFLLGVFTCDITDEERLEALLPSLPGVAALCLENLALYKQGRLDPLTGLSTLDVLYEHLRQETDAIRESFARSLNGEDDVRSVAGRIALIIVSFEGLREVIKRTGYGFADRMIKRLAEAFRTALPDQAVGSRAEDYSFAAVLPGASREEVEHLAAALVQAMDAVELAEPLTGRFFQVRSYAGYAFFPQDMDGAPIRDQEEQPRVLLRKARLAAELVRTRPAGLQSLRIMGYGKLLQEGGFVLQVFPLSRILINLGRSVGAREGQRFSVWSRKDSQSENTQEEPQTRYKGEIVLLQVREDVSVAEILYLGDPAWALEAGDALTFLTESCEAMPENRHLDDGISHRPDPLTGLRRYGYFLSLLAQKSNDCTQFSLALLHIELPEDSSLSHSDHNQLLGQFAALCQQHFHTASVPVSGGRFGLNSLIFFHPDQSPETLEPLYAALSTEANTTWNIHVSTGIARWPFLQFRKTDIIDCSRKALDYALMLPDPGVGLFGSLAMNISADRRHCRGDLFGAIEEYKNSLLADPENGLAWNSLGVCLATLGRNAEARHCFEEALKHSPADSMLLYNLGTVCQTLKDTAAAQTSFEQCLAIAPSHLYAKIRLGQLAEHEGHFEAARIHYRAAADVDTESPLPYRHLARLSMQEHNPEEARAHLHQALLRNPRDAAALSLMATLYLDGGEDPELAESLARQSILQRPDHRKGWLVLARALETLGRTTDAAHALQKASEVGLPSN